MTKTTACPSFRCIFHGPYSSVAKLSEERKKEQRLKALDQEVSSGGTGGTIGSLDPPEGHVEIRYV